MDIQISDIEQARDRINGLASLTPLRKSHELSRRSGQPVYLKLENMQDTGSFKIRGAANRMCQLSEAEMQRGVVAVSTGNHGRAVAYVASQLGIRAVICMTGRVPQVKVDGIRSLGAEVVIHGKDQNESDDKARQLADADGLTFVPPFDDAAVIAGQGTMGLEILEQRPDINTLLVPLSGGGLISGVALAAKSINPNLRIVGVSTAHGACMLESIRAGKIIHVEEKSSLADALPGPIPEDNQYTFRMCRDLVDEHVQVSEQQIAAAIAFILRYERMIVEGGGAVTSAALLFNLVNNLSGSVAAVCSGDNIDPQRALKIFAEQQGAMS